MAASNYYQALKVLETSVEEGLIQIQFNHLPQAFFGQKFLVAIWQSLFRESARAPPINCFLIGLISSRHDLEFHLLLRCEKKIFIQSDEIFFSLSQ